MSFKRFLTASAVFFMCMAVLSAQEVDRAVSRSISEYFKKYTSPRTKFKFSGLDRRRNNIVVNNSTKKIVIYSNEAFSGQAFTPGVVDTIYNDIRKLLPRNLRSYDIEVVYAGHTIDERVPNIYRKKDAVEKERLWQGLDYKNEPWVMNASRPYAVPKGLHNRHIALWQSHGRYYNAEQAIWKWQRPPLYCTTEDMFTQSFVVPFLMPMLENAGAIVYTPRERDWQPECVIVDNDASSTGSRYHENASSGTEWKSRDNGYMPKDSAYYDKENPFVAGTYKVVETSRDAKNASASAVWYPSIPSEGEYAVYVAYHTLRNSVPDASYTVRHSGGSTNFKVNQRMGGGTWVYLGTFHFEKGAVERQCVMLDNTSKHKGVVSADAVRFGGGMGNVVRGDSIPSISGMPKFLEGARYNLQTSGFPYYVYSAYEGEDDYRDDINCRSRVVNYLSGGSVYCPDTVGLKVPIELSFGFHSDAGFSAEDEIVGSLGVVTTEHDGDTLQSGRSRYMSRDLVSYLLNNVQEDLTVHYGKMWPVRGILDRKYSESRWPLVPSLIFESLSHQNFMDMVYGHDPDFKFTLARSVYKSLLKHLAYVHGRSYVVQPLPVSNFRMAMTAEDEVRLDWNPVNDPREPTAKPARYVVYTRMGDGGYDNGTVVDVPQYSFRIKKDVLYSFRVSALNDGGQSLPSEELSLYIAAESKGTVLVVNAFHRLSGPEVVKTPSMAGFDMESDPGVPYIRTPEYCGPQLDFQRANIGYENGLGLSGNNYEGMIIAGNSFNYPAVHGKSLAANGVSFVSCSSDAVMDGLVSLGSFKAVDLILGVEKQGGNGSYLGGYDKPYKTFPKRLQSKIKEYCAAGGSLFISGAFIASDMAKNTEDRRFIRDVLRFDYGGSVSELNENCISGSGLEFSIARTVNERCYAVSRPDILVPLDDAFVSFVFNGNRESAGVAYAGNYRIISTSFPFETVSEEEQRDKLMGAIMRFLMK